MKFKVSDKVVCVGNPNGLPDEWKALMPVIPERGKVYVIREIVRGADEHGRDVPAIQLTGIFNLPHPTKGNPNIPVAFNAGDYMLLSEYRKRGIAKNTGEYDFLNPS